jgi:hypothetical protein
MLAQWNLFFSLFHRGEAYFSGVVKIIAFLGLEPRLNMKNGFNWAGKIGHFSKVSVIDNRIFIMASSHPG